MSVVSNLVDKLHKSLRWASSEPVIYKSERKATRPATFYQGGKHYGGSHAPQCPLCRVTLSRGLCLNRMCRLGARAWGPGAGSHNPPPTTHHHPNG